MLLERPEVQAWWALSGSDIRVAAVVAQLDPPEWHLVCFLAQQAAEKGAEGCDGGRRVAGATHPRSRAAG